MLLVQTIIDRDLERASVGDEGLKMWDCGGMGKGGGEEGIQFSLGMEEVVVGIDEENCSAGIIWRGEGWRSHDVWIMVCRIGELVRDV